MLVLLDDPCQRVTYYPEQRLFVNIVLCVRYGADFRAGCDAVLAKAQELRPSLWLTDNRRMGTLPAEDLTWIAESFLPRFAKLPVERCAIVQSREVMSHLTLLGMLTSATPLITWQERMFHSYEEAWNWLMKVAFTDHLNSMMAAEYALVEVPDSHRETLNIPMLNPPPGFFRLSEARQKQ